MVRPSSDLVTGIRDLALPTIVYLPRPTIVLPHDEVTDTWIDFCRSCLRFSSIQWGELVGRFPEAHGGRLKTI